MKTYKFRGIRYDDGFTIVEANDEADARHRAMCERWGPPVGIYAPRYLGLGLTLIED